MRGRGIRRRNTRRRGYPCRGEWFRSPREISRLLHQIREPCVMLLMLPDILRFSSRWKKWSGGIIWRRSRGSMKICPLRRGNVALRLNIMVISRGMWGKSRGTRWSPETVIGRRWKFMAPAGRGAILRWWRWWWSRGREKGAIILQGGIKISAVINSNMFQTYSIIIYVYTDTSIYGQRP